MTGLAKSMTRPGGPLPCDLFVAFSLGQDDIVRHSPLSADVFGGGGVVWPTEIGELGLELGSSLTRPTSCCC